MIKNHDELEAPVKLKLLLTFCLWVIALVLCLLSPILLFFSLCFAGLEALAQKLEDTHEKA